MPEPVVEIPNRPAFRASEVCEIAQIPPYVLKSWEKEFPGLGTAVKPGGPRVYRRADVEQVLHIKHLLFAEGLTLAGAHRKLEGEPKVDEEPLPDLPVAGEVRDKVARIKLGLRSLLDLLSVPPPEAARPDPGAPADVANASGPEAPAALSSAPPVAEANEPHAAAVPSWPPAQAPSEGGGGEARGEGELPLLEGVQDSAPPEKTPRRPRRAPRSARESS